MAVIELDSVSVDYGDLRALNNVSCKIEPGAVGILGPNGAGKSTLIKTLLGFNRPVEGTVSVFGKSMPEHALEVRQRLGYMPEREVASPRISAVSFLMYCGQLFGMTSVDAMERAHEVLNYVNLGEARYRKMETYSTGMLQRAKLAQALLHDPQLLLLDEPTNGLDPDSRIEMLELVREVAEQRGVTVLLSSHLLPDVQHVCDRIIIVARGTIVQEGTIAEMTAVQDSQYTIRLRDRSDAFVEAVRKVGYSVQEDRDGLLTVTSDEKENGRALFDVALACGTQIRSLHPARHTLAEVFMEAVGEQAQAGDSPEVGGEQE